MSHEERHFVLYTTVSPQHRLVLDMCQIFINICEINYFIGFLELIKIAINLTAWDNRNLFSHHSRSQSLKQWWQRVWFLLGGSCVTCLSPGFWRLPANPWSSLSTDMSLHFLPPSSYGVLCVSSHCLPHPCRFDQFSYKYINHRIAPNPNPLWSHLNSVTSAKILFLNKTQSLRFWVDINFVGEMGHNLIQYGCIKL